MQALLVRHGETGYNTQGMFQGYSPVPLSQRGRQQAALVAARLLASRPRVLYSSDIRRAQETAEIIGHCLALPVQFCEGLREWHVGTWVNQPSAAFAAHLQAVGAHIVTYVPEGGESQLQTQARMVAQMQRLAAQHAGETIVCVSHGKAIDMFVRHVLGLDVLQPPAYSIANASATIFRYENDRWELISLNDVAHLEVLAS